MYFKQFYLGCLSHASYMIGDEKSKTAVDRRRRRFCASRKRWKSFKHIPGGPTLLRNATVG